MTLYLHHRHHSLPPHSHPPLCHQRPGSHCWRKYKVLCDMLSSCTVYMTVDLCIGVQTSPQECQECATAASTGETSSIAATVSDSRIGRQELCELTDDSSDDEMFSTPPTSLPPPDRVSYYSSYSLKQVTLCTVCHLLSMFYSMMTPELLNMMELLQ